MLRWSWDASGEPSLILLLMLLLRGAFVDLEPRLTCPSFSLKNSMLPLAAETLVGVIDLLVVVAVASFDDCFPEVFQLLHWNRKSCVARCEQGFPEPFVDPDQVALVVVLPDVCVAASHWLCSCWRECGWYDHGYLSVGASFKRIVCPCGSGSIVTLRYKRPCCLSISLSKPLVRRTVSVSVRLMLKPWALSRVTDTIGCFTSHA